MKPVIAVVCLVSLLFYGCRPAVDPPEAASSSSAGHLNHAQPKLPTVQLWLGTNELITEVARTHVELQTGMMFRQRMEENEAMLFVFSYPHRAGFYMKNTVIPLSCAYLDGDGTLLEIHRLKPFDESPVVASSDAIRFVLETREGWFDRHQVTTGMVATTSRGALLTTFFRRP
jgi:uncharacterized protein